MRSSGKQTESVATVFPDADAEVCVRHGCARSDGLHAIDPESPDRNRRVLCPEHGFEYLEELVR